jgi:hypothetical protein
MPLSQQRVPPTPRDIDIESLLTILPHNDDSPALEPR